MMIKVVNLLLVLLGTTSMVAAKVGTMEDDMKKGSMKKGGMKKGGMKKGGMKGMSKAVKGRGKGGGEMEVEGMMEKPTYYIYLSGPEVFLASPFEAGTIATAECEKANDPDADFVLEALYPLDQVIDPFAYDLDTAFRIYLANVELMEKSFATASNMIRFRGPSMDVGTAFEMGYVRAQGKPVFGYYDAIAFYGEFEEPGTYAERAAFYNFTESVGQQYDKDGIEVEGFGAPDNLMMWGSYIDSGYEQTNNVYEACVDAVDYIKNNL
jgi:nucleoside 2-deoxyribosyltransferase